MEMISDISVDPVRALGRIWAKLEIASKHVQNETKMFSHFESDVYVYLKSLSKLICAVLKMENNITMVQYSSQKALISGKNLWMDFPLTVQNCAITETVSPQVLHGVITQLP